ncbi:MAG: MATE family efflux transporter [bacterium]|nr:MATE family efflux transporter [bacterium]
MVLENNLGKDDIKSLVRRLAIPSMLAQFVSVLYSVVDRMYIGNIAEVGELALAGVGVCGPIVTLISSFSALIGFGGSPLLSIRMGEKDEEGARQVVANSFMMLCVISVILTIVSLCLKDALLMWFGASEVTFPYANEYITVYLLGTVFALLSGGMNQFIICQGFAKVEMKSVMIGAALNLVLDPIFIFGFHMGAAGGALATVLSQAASAAFVLAFLFGRRPPVRITFHGYSAAICKRILMLGFSPFIIIAFDNILVITLNTTLQQFGGPERGDMMVTCGTIMQSFMLMVTMPLGGITSGTQSILGYNYGARQMNRVRQAELQIVKIAVIFCTVMFVLSQVGCQLFVLLFTRNPEYIAMSVRAIRISTLMIIPLAVQYSFVDGFTGMGIAHIAISLSFWRKLLFFLFVLLLPRLYGVEAVFWTEPIIDVLAAITTSTVYATQIGKILKKRILTRNLT